MASATGDVGASGFSVAICRNSSGLRAWNSAWTAAADFSAFWFRQIESPSSTTTATASPISAGRPYSVIHWENCWTSPEASSREGAGSFTG